METQNKSETKEADPIKDHESALNRAPLGFVRGGTPTTKSAQFFEEQYQESERRREAQDAADHLARIPWEHGGAVQYTNRLTAFPEVPKAWLKLEYVTKAGQSTGQYCLTDVLIGEDPDDPNQMSLIITCPRCLSHGQKHLQDCQLKISKKRKFFVFQTGIGEEEFIFEGKLYKSAGVILESESFKCPECDWRARIFKNQIWPG